MPAIAVCVGVTSGLCSDIRSDASIAKKEDMYINDENLSLEKERGIAVSRLVGTQPPSPRTDRGRRKRKKKKRRSYSQLVIRLSERAPDREY